MTQASVHLTANPIQHRRLALLVTAIALLFAGPATDLSVGTQTVLLGVGVLLTGVPHGAVDHLRMAALRGRRLGTAWLPVFLGGYATVALAVAGIWWLLPAPSLFLFLALSVHHFGSGDADDPVGRLAHGSLPILLPAAVYPGAVGALFALLTGGETLTWQQGLQTAQPLLLSVVALLLTTFLWSRRAGPPGEVLELAGIAAAGVLLPPLLSFAIYFCVWHAPRHIVHVARELWPGSLERALGRFAAAALPMTLATLAGVCIIFAVLPRDVLVSERWLQLLFVSLAALTVPHLMVTDALRRAAPRHASTCVGRGG